MANSKEFQRDIDPLQITENKLILSDIAHPECKSYGARLKSFRSWTKDEIVSKEELSADGFFYKGEDDATTCYFCDVELHSWEEGDSPNKLHKEKSPNCGHLLLIRSTNQESEESSSSSDSSLDESEMSLDGASSILQNGSQQGPCPKETIQVKDVPVEELLEKNRLLKEKLSCKICKDNRRDFVFIPCGHLVRCGRCIVERDIRICPECGCVVQGNIKTYFYTNL